MIILLMRTQMNLFLIGTFWSLYSIIKVCKVRWSLKCAHYIFDTNQAKPANAEGTKHYFSSQNPFVHSIESPL